MSTPTVAPPVPAPGPSQDELIKSTKSLKVPLSFYNQLSMKVLATATKTSAEDLYRGVFKGDFVEPEGWVLPLPPPPNPEP